MISVPDLEQTARSYLRAARALNRRAVNSPDAAFYLCGYAVEIALKARICRTLGWAGYPETVREFASYRSFQTHDLDVLLHLAGNVTEDRIKQIPTPLTEWSDMQEWKPEQRYNPVGTRSAADAARMIRAAAKIMRALL